ncbi:MAG: hypothetical protein ACR2MO_16120 [Acidimicrobiales bacterium]
MSMSLPVALLNLVLGLAYTSYGIMTVIEMKRDWRTLGFTHFGAAWVCMAFTCGPHHLAHAVHVGLEGRSGGPLDLLTALVGLPVGVVWLALRVEAFAGGRGDRFIPGTPRWLGSMPTAAAVYVTALVAAVLAVPGLYRDSLRDWNRVSSQPTAAPAGVRLPDPAVERA